MDDTFDKIVWSINAENDLDEIEEYYLVLSPEKASEKILKIILKVEEIIFAKQWQVDEYDSSCRRIIVQKKFRVLYKIIDKTVLITGVYPTQKDPENIL